MCRRQEAHRSFKPSITSHPETAVDSHYGTRSRRGGQPHGPEIPDAVQCRGRGVGVGVGDPVQHHRPLWDQRRRGALAELGELLAPVEVVVDAVHRRAAKA
jgi:hypothetical protein